MVDIKSYGTAQFKLYTHMQAHTYVCTFFLARFMYTKTAWHDTYVLLHTILACAHMPVSTHNTREMHITSLHK